jgi:hypothetical protein
LKSAENPGYVDPGNIYSDDDLEKKDSIMMSTTINLD